MTYSLKSLILFVTATAIVFGISMSLGPGVLWLIPFALFAYVGYDAYRSDNAIPFWQCVGALVIPVVFLPTLSFYRSEEDVVLSVVFLVLGAWLDFRAILDGAMVTKLIALVLAIPFVYFFATVAIAGIRDYQRIVDYWWG